MKVSVSMFELSNYFNCKELPIDTTYSRSQGIVNKYSATEKIGRNKIISFPLSLGEAVVFVKSNNGDYHNHIMQCYNGKKLEYDIDAADTILVLKSDMQETFVDEEELFSKMITLDNNLSDSVTISMCLYLSYELKKDEQSVAACANYCFDKSTNLQSDIKNSIKYYINESEQNKKIKEKYEEAGSFTSDGVIVFINEYDKHCAELLNNLVEFLADKYDFLNFKDAKKELKFVDKEGKITNHINELANIYHSQVIQRIDINFNTETENERQKNRRENEKLDAINEIEIQSYKDDYANKQAVEKAKYSQILGEYSREQELKNLQVEQQRQLMNVNMQIMMLNAQTGAQVRLINANAANEQIKTIIELLGNIKQQTSALKAAYINANQGINSDQLLNSLNSIAADSEKCEKQLANIISSSSLLP